MSKIEWVEYSRVGPATPEQVARVEERVGHKFPEDLKQALLEHQGMVPKPGALRLYPDRPLKGFGALGNCAEGRSGNIATGFEAMRSWEDTPYPDYLVPISTAKGSPHFALDYRNGEDDPAIVYVLPEFITTPEWIIPAASSFTELLERMEED